MGAGANQRDQAHGASFLRPRRECFSVQHDLLSRPIASSAAKCTADRLLEQDGTVAERPIRLFGDPVLRTSCDAIGKFDDALISLVTDLEETVSAPGRAGLAANQIGVSRRVFAYDVDRALLGRAEAG